MNQFNIIDLLKDLPDDIIESANRPRQRRSHYMIRLKYIVPTLAACFIGILCLTIYLILKTSTPGSLLITDTSSISESNASTFTTVARTETDVSNNVSDSNMTIDTSQQFESTVSSMVTNVIDDSVIDSSITITTFSEYVISDERSTSISTKDTMVISEVSTTQVTDHTSVNTTITTGTDTPPMTTGSNQSSKTVSYTLEKSICLLPELPSGGVIDPVTGQPISFDARIECNDEIWNVVLAEPCEDACIVSGVIRDHVLYLSVACLSAQGDYNEETVCFSLCFSENVGADIAEIRIERQDFGNAAEYNTVYTNSPIILNNP